MSSGIAGKDILRVNYGIRVNRASAGLAQTGNLTLFNVTGGRILLTTITGTVTGAIQAQADAVKLQTVSTTGSITTDLCATVDLNAAAAGNLFGIVGVTATAAVIGAMVPQLKEVIIGAGIIRMNAAASNTGTMSWTLTYVPLDDGAAVTAA